MPILSHPSWGNVLQVSWHIAQTSSIVPARTPLSHSVECHHSQGLRTNEQRGALWPRSLWAGAGEESWGRHVVCAVCIGLFVAGNGGCTVIEGVSPGKLISIILYVCWNQSRRAVPAHLLTWLFQRQVLLETTTTDDMLLFWSLFHAA